MNTKNILCYLFLLFSLQLSAQVVDSCTIFNVFAEAHDCDENGNFLVDIEFDAADTGETFEIRGNGRSYGIFEYGETFYTVGPIAGDEARTLEFVIIDQQDNSCQNFTTLRHSGCGNNGGDSTLCNIRDLYVDPLTCQANGQYFTTIDFIYEFTDNDFVDVFINGEFYGFYDLGELPIKLENLGLPDSVLTVSVCVNDNRDCCAEQTVFDFVNCEDSSTCSIENLFLSEVECQDNEIISGIIDFEYTDPNNDFFDLYINNEFSGFYRLDELPLQLDSLPFSFEQIITIDVCINDNPNCCAEFEYFINIPELICYARYVWPGDINLDNIVGHQDLLWLGYAFNSTGFERENASLEWLPQLAPIWMEGFPFTSGVHSRSHADTNGDGIVNELDLEALFVNYGKTHGLIEPFDSLEVEPNDPALQFNLPPDDSINNEEILSVPITLGTSDNPIDDIYGLSFTLQFNPQVINPESIEIQYPTSWLGEPQVNVLTIDKTFGERGIIQIAITRNDQNNVSGYGEIARFVGMIDDIIGYGKVEVEVAEIYATMLNGRRIPLNTYKLERAITDVSTINNNLAITLFPNPTTKAFTIYAPQFKIEQVRIYSMTGQLLEIAKNSSTIHTNNWKKGIYLIEIQTAEGTAFRKLIKQ